MGAVSECIFLTEDIGTQIPRLAVTRIKWGGLFVFSGGVVATVATQSGV